MSDDDMPGTPRRDGAEPEAAEPDASRRVDPRLLEMLVCPLTKTVLRYDAQAGELVSRAARLAYPIRDGIPIMLPEEARPLTEEEARER